MYKSRYANLMQSYQIEDEERYAKGWSHNEEDAQEITHALNLIQFMQEQLPQSYEMVDKFYKEYASEKATLVARVESFGIDRQKLENEKDQMLAQLRGQIPDENCSVCGAEQPAHEEGCSQR